MTLQVVGVDFRTSPLEIRGQLCVQILERLSRICPNWREKILVSTCNRVEIYGVGAEDGGRVIERWLKEVGLNEEHRKSFFVLENQDALAHLFRVSSSLESMVVGEAQILGQMKRAYEMAVERGTVGAVLHRCFQTAFKLAKRIRTQTDVGRLATSIPSIGVKLAERVIGDLSSKVVGILGLGEIGRVAAEHFGSVQPKKLYLYNRTRKVSEEFCEKLKAENIQSTVAETLDDILNHADVVVSAVDIKLLGNQELHGLARRGVPILILDLAVPSSVEKTEETPLFIYGVDDLKNIAEENNRLRGTELEKAQALIEEGVLSCWKTLSPASMSQTFSQLSEKIEKLTNQELVYLKSNLSHCPEADWKEIEKMAHRLSSKILQDPMLELKSLVETEEKSEDLLRFFRNLFRI